jgi:hypothetical protein
MDDRAKKLKELIKRPAPKSTFGTNPTDPWSAKYDLAETAMLDRYLSARGINPKFVPVSTKVSHAKSNQFKMWARNHRNEDVQLEDLSHTAQQSGGKTAERANELTKRVKQHKEIKTPPTSMHTVKSVKPHQEEHENCGTPDCCGRCDTVQIEEAKQHDDISAHLNKHGIGSHWRNKNTCVVHDKHVDKVQKFMDKHTGGYVNVVGHSQDVHEEVEQVEEANYTNIPSVVSNKVASGMTRAMHKAAAKRYEADADDAHKEGKTHKRDWANDMAKNHHQAAKEMEQNEDMYQDPQAATQTVFDGANNTNDLAEKRRQLSKSARMIKALYKKHRVSEDMYDHEKEDKSVATYGKKPKMDTADKKDSMGENKPKAAAVVSGGTTLTGQDRDTIEIDPQMRVRPGQPDPTKKDDKKKDDDKKEGKKDK